MDRKERLVVPWEFKAAAAEGSDALFEGYASIFGNVDLGGDVIEAGAFKKSIRALKGKVPLFWRHDEPIGTAEVEEDEKGLKTLGSPLVGTVQRATEAMALVKAGAVRAMSIGYIARKASRDDKTGIRTLKEVELLEVSLVPWGMNPLAGVTAAKAADFGTDTDALVAALVAGTPLAEDFAKALAVGISPRVQFAQDELEELAASVNRATEILRT